MKRSIALKELGKSDFRISRALYLYIIYILFLSLTDITSLPLFYIHQNRFLMIAILVSLALSLGMGALFSRYFEFIQEKLNENKIIYLLLVLLIAFLRGLEPDTSYDVSMGRVYWQTPGFVDNISENVFPAGFTFFFR